MCKTEIFAMVLYGYSHMIQFVFVVSSLELNFTIIKLLEKYSLCIIG